MKKANIGLIGLAVMGENLAMNMESHGYTVAVYNRTAPGEEGVVDRFVNGRGKGKKFIGAHSIEDLVSAIEKPRKVMMMVKAGQPVDDLIEQLIPFLSSGDTIIDGGNSDYRDTARRVKMLEGKGLLFVGTGISGGETGALTGPSIMPGGSLTAWPQIKNILQDISAKADDGAPCCEWIGSGGAGHYVKMVHNGIEYGDMQLIAETYSMLKNYFGLDNEEMSKLFTFWNKGELNSYLIEITGNILRHKDMDGTYLLDKILDVAGQKGTGKLSVEAALDEHDPLTLITEAVYARMLSAMKDERTKANEIYYTYNPVEHRNISANDLKDALYASKLVSYAQGFSLLRKAAKANNWDLDYGTIASIWRKGCIIRSAFLEDITKAYNKNAQLENLLFDDFFRNKIEEALPAWRKVIAEGVLHGIALPAMTSALSYFDGLRTLHSPANLIQAQRDYFGAHTYERVDWERGKFFHTKWTEESGDTISGSYNV